MSDIEKQIRDFLTALDNKKTQEEMSQQIAEALKALPIKVSHLKLSFELVEPAKVSFSFEYGEGKPAKTKTAKGS